MQANGQVTTNGAGAGAGTGVAEEPRTKEHISYLVGQTKNPNKLRTVERLLQQPGSRVFVPQSEAGSMLFNRLMDLDIAFAACGRASWRNSTDEGLAKKQRLETDLHTLNRTLIQFTAQVAVEYELDPKRMDAAVITQVRALKAEVAETTKAPHATGEAAVTDLRAATGKRTRGKGPTEPDAPIASGPAPEDPA